MSIYEALYQRSLDNLKAFWAEAAEQIHHWYKRWDKVVDDSNKPFCRWFSVAELNTCYSDIEGRRRSVVRKI
ncbi:MAG: acetyl-coenzyme A synthetase N-terminal domain-containing protein [Pseudomonadota bacterium]